MNKSPPKSPQEKKSLSYAEDRRNSYGQNDKASRKAIPLRKAGENRQDRHKIKQDLAGLPELDEAAAALIESSARQDLNRTRGWHWKKAADIPLSEYLELQRRRLSFRTRSKKTEGTET